MKAKVKKQPSGILWSSNYSEQKKVFPSGFTVSACHDYNASLNSDLPSKGEKRKNNRFQWKERDKTCLLEIFSCILKRNYYFQMSHTDLSAKVTSPRALILHNHRTDPDQMTQLFYVSVYPAVRLRIGGFPTLYTLCYRLCNCSICLFAVTTSLPGFDPLQSYIWAAGRKAAFIFFRPAYTLWVKVTWKMGKVAPSLRAPEGKPVGRKRYSELWWYHIPECFLERNAP